MRAWIFLFIFVPATGFAKPSLIVDCCDLKGMRFDSKNGQTKTSSDGITGFTSKFIFMTYNQDKVMVLWGGSHEASVVRRTKNQITAVRAIPSKNPGMVAMDEVHMYSLYPQRGILYFTLHRYLNNGVPNSASFYADCKFSDVP